MLKSLYFLVRDCERPLSLGIAMPGVFAESSASHYSFMFSETELYANTRDRNLNISRKKFQIIFGGIALDIPRYVFATTVCKILFLVRSRKENIIKILQLQPFCIYALGLCYHINFLFESYRSRCGSICITRLFPIC